MRLSTDPSRDPDRGVEVILAALDAGVSLLDTADAYCLDETEVGHNERLVATAVAQWSGNRATLRVATKGGLTRPKGRWVPDGRAKHLRAACEASCRALGVDAIDLYQLHAVDPRVPLRTSVRALAKLQADGLVRDIGLCNVTVHQIEAARSEATIAAIQVGMSGLDDTNLRNGVAEYCRDHGLELIVYRPLGGTRRRRLDRDAVLRELAARHDATPSEIALAWLRDLAPRVTTIPGPTRVDTARSLGRVSAIVLDGSDRARLDARFPAGRLLRIPQAERRPPDDADGDVVLVMGMPAAGKSTVARDLVARGYRRLNRDERGGTLDDLVDALDEGLRPGPRRWVLDNTYPARHTRNAVVECAWRHGVPVRCVWLRTPKTDAQVNAVSRMIDRLGHLPTPEEIAAVSKSDPGIFGPSAQLRYERELEPPTDAEGFTRIDERDGGRAPSPAGGTRRALVLEFDGTLCGDESDPPVLHPSAVRIPPERIAVLERYGLDGWLILALAWRPQLTAGTVSEQTIRDCFDRARALVGVDMEFGCCPHPAGPPRCWCRKPYPGLVLDLLRRHGGGIAGSVVVGQSPADQRIAETLHVTYRHPKDFFPSPAG